MLLVEGLTEVCRQILILAGLSLFLEVLLPGGSLKKYTQFVMGLLLVAALLNPLLGLTRGRPGAGGAGVGRRFGAADCLAGEFGGRGGGLRG